MVIKTECIDSSSQKSLTAAVTPKLKDSTESKHKPQQNLKPILKPAKSQIKLNSEQKSNEDQKQKLKKYLSEYNYELVKNSTKTDNLTLNLRKIITDFKEFNSSSQTNLKYLANYLFHINHKELKGLLLCLPSWNHCKIKGKIMYSLINKFLKNKEEVMKNLKLYYKDAKTVKITTNKSDEQEDNDNSNGDDDGEDDNDADIEKMSSSYDIIGDDLYDVEPANDNNSGNSGITEHINIVITKLNEFMKTHSISKEYFSKNYLNTDIETFNIILLKKISHTHFKYLYKIEGFLNDQEMKNRLIKENNLLIYKKKTENEINIKAVENNLYIKSGDNMNSSKIDIEVSEENNQNKRLLRNRIQTPIQVQKNASKPDNSLPYDPSNVNIESIKIFLTLIQFKLFFS